MKSMLEKFVKWQRSRSECCDFTKKNELHNFWQEKWPGKRNEWKFWELTVWNNLKRVSKRLCEIQNSKKIFLVWNVSMSQNKFFSSHYFLGFVVQSPHCFSSLIQTGNPLGKDLLHHDPSILKIRDKY